MVPPLVPRTSGPALALVAIESDIVRGQSVFRQRDTLMAVAVDPDAIWVLNAVPFLRPLRREPRYRRLLVRMSLPEQLRQ